MEDWRQQTLQRMRELILSAHPDIVEEVKLTFARGASIPDPDGIFNASLDAGTRRAIDLRVGDAVNADAFTALIRRAADLNGAGRK